METIPSSVSFFNVRQEISPCLYVVSENKPGSYILTISFRTTLKSDVSLADRSTRYKLNDHLIQRSTESNNRYFGYFTMNCPLIDCNYQVLESSSSVVLVAFQPL